MGLGVASSLLIVLNLRRLRVNATDQRSTHICGFPKRVYMIPVGTMRRFPMMNVSATYA